jgi:hypothetical protein
MEVSWVTAIKELCSFGTTGVNEAIVYELLEAINVVGAAGYLTSEQILSIYTSKFTGVAYDPFPVLDSVSTQAQPVVHDIIDVERIDTW